MEKTIIYLIRHAEKLKKGIVYLSDNDSKDITERMILTIEGERAARKLSKYYEFKNIDKIYSSHYSRALATAKYLAKSLNQTIYVDNRLGEIVSGKIDVDKKIFESNRRKNFDYKCLDGESINDVKMRMSNFLNDVLKNEKGKEIAVFSHHIAFICLLTKYCKVTYDINDHLRLEYHNTVINEKWQSPDVYKLTFVDYDLKDIEHLNY